MRKTYNIEHPKIKVPRMFAGVKNDYRKYVKRERKKPLPKGVDYWDFDCKFGNTEAEAKPVHLAELTKCIDTAEEQGLMSFFIEIVAKPGIRMKRKPADADDEAKTKPDADAT